MGHYAKIEDGVVTDVIVAKQDFIETLDGTWVKTSYNIKGGVYYNPVTGEPAEDQSVIGDEPARQRANFASIGRLYDADNDIFHDPQPYPSWKLDMITGQWSAPIPLPDNDRELVWDEEAYQADNTTGWRESDFYAG